MGEDTAQGPTQKEGDALRRLASGPGSVESDAEETLTELEGGQVDSGQESGGAPGRRQVGETNTQAINSSSNGHKTSSSGNAGVKTRNQKHAPPSEEGLIMQRLNALSQKQPGRRSLIASNNRLDDCVAIDDE